MRSNWPRGPYGVFTVGDASTVGITAKALRHGTDAGQIVRVQHGIYVARERWDGDGPEADRARMLLRSVAATIATRGSVASHTSSALLASLPVWELPSRPCITVAPRYTGDARHAHLHRARLNNFTMTRGVPRTSIARTVLDIAREHDIEDALVVGDAALARQLTDGDHLYRVAEFCAGWPGIRRAVQLLELLDARAESPLESVSRFRLLRSGLPAPEPQVDIFDLNGRFLGRVDLYWDDFGVAGEVDGKVKYRESPDAVYSLEKRRQERMEDTFLSFVRWGRSDLDDMNLLASRIHAAFRRGSRLPRSERGWIARPSGLHTPLAPQIDPLTAS